MNLLGIYGSPRKAGNTDLLLDQVMAGAAAAGADCRTVYCRRLQMSGCLACGGCDDTGECVLDDDMDQVYPLLRWARAIVMAVPIYFYAPPGQVKLLIDRAQACWNHKLLTKGRGHLGTYDSGQGYLVGVGATKGQNLFEPTDLIAKYFYDALDMSYQGGLFYRRLEDKGAVLQHQDKLQEAYELGKRIAGGK